MVLNIVPSKKLDWPPPYKAATEKYSSQVQLTREGRLGNYVAGQPFPLLDPNDPQVATKIMWNFSFKPLYSDDVDIREPEIAAFNAQSNGTPTSHLTVGHFAFYNNVGRIEVPFGRGQLYLRSDARDRRWYRTARRVVVFSLLATTLDHSRRLRPQAPLSASAALPPARSHPASAARRPLPPQGSFPPVCDAADTLRARALRAAVTFPQADGQVSRQNALIDGCEPGQRCESAQRADHDRNETMLEPDFDPVPTAVEIGRCAYACPCRAPRCAEGRATIVLRKIDAAGRPVRQIELCDRHAEAVIARERKRGFEIFDRSDWVQASFEPCCAWVAHFK
jgi:hypothetical protein